MPDAYEIHDAQFLQKLSGQSAVAGLSCYLSNGIVPGGKVWTFLSAFINVDVAETRNFWFSILSQGHYFPVTLPQSFALDPATQKYYPMLREGMEIKLFPGERLYAFRDVATAGSTMTIYSRVIETDLQYYVELDKHKVLQRRQMAMEASSPMRRTGLLSASSRTAPLAPPSRPRFER